MLVTLAEWEQFYLPNSNGGAHVAVLGIETDEADFAVDGSQMVTLEQMTWAMIQYSDNAALDYITNLLGQEAFNNIVVEQGLNGQTQYVPLSALFLSWRNHDQPVLRGEHFVELEALSSDAYLAQATALQNQYVTDAVWREAEIAWRLEREMSVVNHEVRVAKATVPLFGMWSARARLAWQAC